MAVEKEKTPSEGDVTAAQRDKDKEIESSVEKKKKSLYTHERKAG